MNREINGTGWKSHRDGTEMAKEHIREPGHELVRGDRDKVRGRI